MDTIVSGKLRRYNHLTLWQHITWPSLMAHNLKDSFLVGIGITQSFFKLLFWRPNVIFAKGGYVCLPVGIAANLLRIPIVVHDSDAHPGLTNRILSKWAKYIATGAPLDYYSYPKKKSSYVGIPIDSKFKPATRAEQLSAKEDWSIPAENKLLVVTGGGLGAKRINDTVVKVLPELQKLNDSKLSVVLVAGASQYEDLKTVLPKNSKNFQMYPFINNMHSLLAAADVVVTRAGATTILELAAAEKPTILIPNAKLTGGHQVKNAKVYADAGAVVVLDEDDIARDASEFVKSVSRVLADEVSTKAMAKSFSNFAKPNAAKDVATLIEKAVKA